MYLSILKFRWTRDLGFRVRDVFVVIIMWSDYFHGSYNLDITEKEKLKMRKWSSLHNRSTLQIFLLSMKYRLIQWYRGQSWFLRVCVRTEKHRGWEGIQIFHSNQRRNNFGSEIMGENLINLKKGHPREVNMIDIWVDGLVLYSWWTQLFILWRKDYETVILFCLIHDKHEVNRFK